MQVNGPWREEGPNSKIWSTPRSAGQANQPPHSPLLTSEGSLAVFCSGIVWLDFTAKHAVNHLVVPACARSGRGCEHELANLRSQPRRRQGGPLGGPARDAAGQGRRCWDRKQEKGVTLW